VRILSAVVLDGQWPQSDGQRHVGAKNHMELVTDGAPLTTSD